MDLVSILLVTKLLVSKLLVGKLLIAGAVSGLPQNQQRDYEEARQTFIENRDQNLFFGLHETWEAASKQAAEFGSVGYDNNPSAAIYDHRTRIDMYDYPALCWLLRSMHEGHRQVGDIGGSIGIKYIAYREALAPWPDLRWKVFDVPAAVAHGRELSAARGDSERLNFADSFDDLQDCDVLNVSGVLQYLPQTLGAAIAGWEKRPKRIIINTTPIHPDFSFFTVNSIGTSFCPYRVQTHAGLVRELAKLNYRVRESWINPDKRMTIPFQPEHSLNYYSGFCLDRKV